ncbi:unnamed protein product [Sphagnum jensenii]
MLADGLTEGRTNVGRKYLRTPGPGRPAERATVALQRSARPEARPGQASTAGFEVVRHWAMEAASRAEAAAAEVVPPAVPPCLCPFFRVSPAHFLYVRVRPLSSSALSVIAV